MSEYFLSQFLKSGYKGEKGDKGDTGEVGAVIRDVSQETQSRVLVSDDYQKLLMNTTTTDITFTIPTDSAVDFPISVTIHFAQDGSGRIFVVGDDGVSVRIRNGLTNKTAVQYSIASATKVGPNVWYLYGDLE